MRDSARHRAGYVRALARQVAALESAPHGRTPKGMGARGREPLWIWKRQVYMYASRGSNRNGR